jgi:hemolysin III
MEILFHVCEKPHNLLLADRRLERAQCVAINGPCNQPSAPHSPFPRSARRSTYIRPRQDGLSSVAKFKLVCADTMHRSEIFNSASHLVGATAALAGASVLVVLAAQDGDVRRIVAFSVYGASLFFLYLMSSLYHGLSGRAKLVFRVLDHQAIYLLIAGTYTPFTLLTLRGVVGWWLFGAIWSMAAIGMLLDVLQRNGRRILPMIIYLAMGWLVVLALDPLLAALPAQGMRWLVAGGVFYTSGVVFYAVDHRYHWAHGVWHLFVLAGSVSHYFAILFYI